MTTFIPGTFPTKLNKRGVTFGIALLTLVFLNAGLYTQLSPRSPTNPARIPYDESFDNPDLTAWFVLNGEWSPAAGQLTHTSNPDEQATIIAPVRVSQDQSYRLDVTIDREDERPAGIWFNQQHPRLPQRNHFVHLDQGEDGSVVVYGYRDPAGAFHPQASVNIAAVVPDTTQLTVWVSSDNYAIAVDGQRVAQDIPLIYQGGWVGLATTSPMTAFDDLRIYPWGVADNTAVPNHATAESQPQSPPASEQVAVPTGTIPMAIPDIGDVIYQGQLRGRLEDTGWLPFSGTWMLEDGSLVQRDTEGYDQSISYQEQFESYMFRVTLRHLEGAGGGVLFNMTQPDSLAGSQLVRYTDDGTGIFWGYFDANNSFIGQGFVALPTADNTPHVLEIFSVQDAYALRVDGTMIVAGVPLFSPRGYIGLTSSQSSVAFDTIEVFDLAPRSQAGSTGDILDSFSAISGDWSHVGTTIRQLDRAPSNFVNTTGVGAQNYTLKVNILLPDDPDVPDVGGGVIFHMPDDQRTSGAHVVRFADAGQTIMWGYFDASETFVTQGQEEIQLEPGVQQALTLVVQDDAYDILVNDAAIATQNALQRTRGRIGLLSFRGPVEFSNFQLTLTQ